MVYSKYFKLSCVIFILMGFLFASLLSASATPVNVTLVYPENAQLLTTNSTTLNYTVNVESNCSVYHNKTGNWSADCSTNGTTGGSCSIDDLSDGFYTWNVYCVDSTNDSNSDWASENYTFSVITHYLSGYVKYLNKTAVNGTNVSVLLYEMSVGAPPTLLNTYSALSDSDGLFNITNISMRNTDLFKLVIKKYNKTNSEVVDWIGPSLPEFPENMFNQMNNITFYLKAGATINISAINITGGTKTFQYQIKDTRLGYPIQEAFDMSGVTNVLLHVPSDRDYSVMIYPNESFPVSVDISSSELQDSYFQKTFNCTDSMDNRLTGYLDVNSNNSFDNIYFISYLLEPGRMIYFGANSWAMSNFTLMQGEGDKYNSSTGFYNISFLGPEENSSLITIAIGRLGSDYYGAFKEIKLTYNGVAYTNGTLITSDYNISLEKFAGSDYNITTNGGDPSSQNLTLGAFNITVLFNGSAIQQQTHLEVEIDYDDYNMTNFTFMADISSSDNGLLRVPLLNMTGVDRINIYSQAASPTKKKLNVTQVNQGTENISLRENMDMKTPGGEEMDKDLFIDMIKNSSDCNVPNYNQSDCSFFGGIESKEGGGFDPFKVVMSGASMSFVMKNEDGVTVIYTGVDMMASGPPDAVFDEDADDKEGSSSFEEVWRFGSTGPEIYDYVIIGVPYTEGSTSQTGFNESSDFNLTIPCLYGEDFDVPVWNGSSNGFNVTLINTSDDLKDFRDYLNTGYEFYINSSKGVTCNVTDSNLSSGLCYKDTTNNMIWFKIKHFSGLGPSVSGDIITAEEEEQPPSGGGGGGGGGTPVQNTTNVTNQTQLNVSIGNMTLNDTLKPGKDLLKHGKFGKGEIKNFLFRGENHSIKVIEIIETSPGMYSITIEIKSEPITLTLNLGETRNVDMNQDGVYDISVTFEKMENDKAVVNVNELVPVGTLDTGQGKNLTWLWLTVCIVIVAAFAVLAILITRKKGPYKKN